jgi:hypothetical protein
VVSFRDRIQDAGCEMFDAHRGRWLDTRGVCFEMELLSAFGMHFDFSQSALAIVVVVLSSPAGCGVSDNEMDSIWGSFVSMLNIIQRNLNFPEGLWEKYM